jgi:hypothetical protein
VTKHCIVISTTAFKNWNLKKILLGSHNVKMIVLTKCLSTSNKYVGNLNSFYSLGAHHTEQDAIILGHHPISPLLHNCIVK